MSNSCYTRCGKNYKQIKKVSITNQSTLFHSKDSYTGVVTINTVNSGPVTVKVERIGVTVTLNVSTWLLNTIGGGPGIFSINLDSKYRPTQIKTFVVTVDNAIGFGNNSFGVLIVNIDGTITFGVNATNDPFSPGIDAGFDSTGISYLVD
uniref:Uncharacterized protein n=1 Tax=Pithovirus LCPAC001 TaxID=2506585 RepID=A0A481Z287_9VIRU|nr:MAG: hypothetical protein LCPAC001_00550 [Pithovirus LCPAC001]